MTDSITPAERFQALRGRLFGLSYRMVGSRADAEDLVQEAYLRWHEADHDRIESAEAWLVTTTTRLALDRLRRLKTERDAYAGPWLPEPIVGPAPSVAPAPDQHLDLADDLSMAFLTLLERLAPEERAAFLLHDVFEVGLPRDRVGARAERSGVPPGRPPRARAGARRTEALRGHRGRQGSPAAASSLAADGSPRRAGACSSCSRRTRPGRPTAAARLRPPRDPVTGVVRIAQAGCQPAREVLGTGPDHIEMSLGGQGETEPRHSATPAG